MEKAIEKLTGILNLAENNYSKFSANHSDSLVYHGEREKDGAIYEIDITDNLILYLTSQDYHIKQFEVISKSNSITDKSNHNNLIFKV